MTSELIPNISIIIPTINREGSLTKTLSCLENQINVNFEIIVIHQSNFSSLKTNEFQLNISLIKSSIESASAARNLGILNSKGNILLFIDDDILIEDKNYVYNHFKHYSDKQIVGVVGRSYEHNDQEINYTRKVSSYKKNIGFLYYPKNYGVNTFFSSGRSNNLSVRKKYAIEAGGMDENYIRGGHREETDFCLRVNNQFGPFLYDPNAKLIHLNDSSGGIRSWSKDQYIRDYHNILGAIYFFLKMSTFNNKLEFLYATLRYLFLNKTVFRRPKLYYPILKKTIKAYIQAYKLYKSGPKHITSLNKTR